MEDINLVEFSVSNILPIAIRILIFQVLKENWGSAYAGREPLDADLRHRALNIVRTEVGSVANVSLDVECVAAATVQARVEIGDHALGRHRSLITSEFAGICKHKGEISMVGD